ncbi:MAG: hypothetical protein HY644_07355 [Acidobacteria bacterium]|nr:hypothetical protein [Acidobacteriota bacterium]
MRLALRQFLQATPTGRSRPADRVRGLLGSLESDLPHLAEDHRRYIVESLKSGH